MKNLLLLISLYFLSLVVNGQARLEGDTLYYNGNKYWVGKTITTAYGSDGNKDFVFVLIGPGLSPVPAHSSWSKADVVIEKIYRRGDKYYLKGKGPRKTNFHIDIEGAIDNNEIKPDQ